MDGSMEAPIVPFWLGVSGVHKQRGVHMSAMKTEQGWEVP